MTLRPLRLRLLRRGKTVDNSDGCRLGTEEMVTTTEFSLIELNSRRRGPLVVGLAYLSVARVNNGLHIAEHPPNHHLRSPSGAQPDFQDSPSKEPVSLILITILLT